MITDRLRMLSLTLLVPVLAVSAQVQAAPSERFIDVVVVLERAFAAGTPAANRSQAAEIAQSLALSPRYAYGAALFGFAARIPEGRLKAIEAAPMVAYVSVDARLHAVAPKWCADNPAHPACSENDGGGGSTSQILPWGVDRIDADLNTGTGNGVHVYVLDTGIDLDHPDLRANLGASVSCLETSGGRPWSRSYTCADGGDDDNGHGTHVAGTIAAADNDVAVVGVAPQATLHAVKVLDQNGSGSTSAIIAGIDWVAGQINGAPVVANMSLGGSGSKTGTCSGSGFTGSDAFHEALCNATRAGAVFVVAAGNDGSDAEGFIPAAYDDTTIAVSATSAGDDWPEWSNWGDNATSLGNSAPVAIAAPGVDIVSTWNDGSTRTASGTSMAAPHVAGAAALYLDSTQPAADYSAFMQSRGALLSSDESTSGFSNTSGNPHGEDFLDAENL